MFQLTISPKRLQLETLLYLNNSTAKCYSIIYAYVSPKKFKILFFCHHEDMSQIIKCILVSSMTFLIYI